MESRETSWFECVFWWALFLSLFLGLPIWAHVHSWRERARRMEEDRLKFVEMEECVRDISRMAIEMRSMK